MYSRLHNSMHLGLGRRGFTLVELLVTIAIIGILASLLLGVAAIAAETGREAKTKALIAKLHTLLMEHYDTYRDKRVEIKAPVSGKDLAQWRLRAAREQMKMEMPDRWSDLLLISLGDGSNPSNLAPKTINFSLPANQPQYLAYVPSLAEIYRGVYFRIAARDLEVGTLIENQSAECLYMIITYATGDGEARAQFKETDIADTDGDGAPEFVDGWGRPIQFLRWAPGYSSDQQLSIARLDEIGDEAVEDLRNPDKRQAIAAAIAADHDPVDLFRVDQPYDAANTYEANAVRGFRLMPLIFSGGRDEAEGLVTLPWGVNFLSDPYTRSGISYLGEPVSDEAVDNITNHLITAN